MLSGSSIRRLVFLAASGALLLRLTAGGAQATDAVVTDCSSDSHLRIQLAAVQASGGGTLRFDCGSAPPPIVLTSVLPTITAPTVIDGEGRISLSGGNSTRLVYVAGSGRLRLQGIVLTNGYSPGDGGAIRNDGSLEVSNSTIRNSIALGSGGAIVSYGPLTITASSLTGNQAANGGALYPRFPAARTTVIDSRLSDNRTTSTTDGWGGAVLLWDGATLLMRGGELARNTALMGGALHTRFANSSVELSRVALLGNSAIIGGAIYIMASPVLVRNSTIAGNEAEAGGGIFAQQSTQPLVMTETTVRNNRATEQDGGIRLDGARAQFTNVTIAGNYGYVSGGLTAFNANVQLINVTLARNRVSSSINGSNLNSVSSTLVLANTVIADGEFGANCTAAYDTHTANFSLFTDNSCLFSGSNNQVAVPAQLGQLQDNGGGTATLLPAPQSLLVDRGQCFLPQLPADQRGVPRPQGDACDIGAVERAPLDAEHHLYLAVVLHP